MGGSYRGSSQPAGIPATQTFLNDTKKSASTYFCFGFFDPHLHLLILPSSFIPFYPASLFLFLRIGPIPGLRTRGCDDINWPYTAFHLEISEFSRLGGHSRPRTRCGHKVHRPSSSSRSAR